MRHALIVSSVLLAGCAGGDPGKDQPLLTVFVQSPSDGSFTWIQRNAFGAGGSGNGTITGTGRFQEISRSASYGQADTSLQQMSGSYTGAYLIVGFGSRAYGGGPGFDVGAASGSIASLDGPMEQISPCQIRFGPSAGAGSTYRLSYRLTATRSAHCAAP